MQSLLDRNNRLVGIPDDLNVFFKQAWDEDARIHTNSWGRSPALPGFQSPYDSSSTAIDKSVCEHLEIVILFAAGDDGTDRNKNGQIDPAAVGSEAAAKNCITVGATESLRPDIKYKARLGLTSLRGGHIGQTITPQLLSLHLPITWLVTHMAWLRSPAGDLPREEGTSRMLLRLGRQFCRRCRVRCWRYVHIFFPAFPFDLLDATLMRAFDTTSEGDQTDTTV